MSHTPPVGEVWISLGTTGPVAAPVLPPPAPPPATSSPLARRPYVARCFSPDGVRGTSRIVGRATDQDGSPAATGVFLYNRRSGTLIARAVPDAVTGEFSFGNLRQLSRGYTVVAVDRHRADARTASVDLVTPIP
jgi:hypothetical protein